MKGASAVSAGLIAIGACSQVKDIEIKDVPPVVLEAALKSVRDFVIERAELEREEGELIYELESRSSKGGFEYEIEITTEGEILEIEKDGKKSDSEG